MNAELVNPGRFVYTPHPVILDGQKNIPVDLMEGESLRDFLARHIDLREKWEVAVEGDVIDEVEWATCYPKMWQTIEVRGAVGKSVLYIVAMMALTYFTFGGGAIAGWSIGTSTVFGTFAAQALVYVGGPALIARVQR